MKTKIFRSLFFTFAVTFILSACGSIKPGMFHGKEVAEYNTGATVFRIDGNHLYTIADNNPRYEIDQNIVKDYSTGITVFEIEGNLIKDIASGTSLYVIR